MVADAWETNTTSGADATSFKLANPSHAAAMNTPSLDGEDEAYQAITATIHAARQRAAQAVNEAMVEAYWVIGQHIVSIQDRESTYGTGLLSSLSRRLTAEFGRGYSVRNLRIMAKFFRTFPNRQTLSADLSWSHYSLLLTEEDEKARSYYMNAAAQEHWSVRELKRQMDTRSYERLLTTQKELTGATQTTGPIEAVLKDPMVLEFLNLPNPYHESELEQGLVNALEDFLLELGSGFTFVARQKRVHDETSDYYIDLVFYNYLLSCFVLIDLKTGKLNPRDVGQMDFYCRLFDEQYRPADANPTIGIILWVV